MATVTVHGFRELEKTLKELPKALRKEVVNTVVKTAFAVQRDAKKACPVGKQVGLGSGRLRSSIRPYFYTSGMSAEIGTNVNYAQFVEFGTGRRGSSTGNAPKYDALYMYGPKPGMNAQPFLFPAFEKNKRDFLAGINSALAKVGKQFTFGKLSSLTPGTGGVHVGTVDITEGA